MFEWKEREREGGRKQESYKLRNFSSGFKIMARVFRRLPAGMVRVRRLRGRVRPYGTRGSSENQ